MFGTIARAKESRLTKKSHRIVVALWLTGGRCEMLQAVFAAAPGGVRKEFGRSFGNLLDR